MKCQTFILPFHYTTLQTLFTYSSSGGEKLICRSEVCTDICVVLILPMYCFTRAMFLNLSNSNFSFEVVKFVYDKLLDMKGTIKYVLFTIYLHSLCMYIVQCIHIYTIMFYIIGLLWWPFTSRISFF